MTRSTHAHGSDALGFHLRELAESLDLRSFQALSVGLGLGELKPKEAARIPLQVPLPMEMSQVAAMPQAASPAQARPSSPNQVQVHQSEPRRQQSPYAAHAADVWHTNEQRQRPIAHGGRVSRMVHRLYAWVIDLSLVVISLGLALACAAVALSLGEGKEDFWYDGGPLSWLLKFQIVEVVLVIAGVFVMYLGVFKLVAGKTFGESLAFGVGKKNGARH